MEKIKGSKPIWNEQEKMLFSAKVLEYGIDLKRLVQDIPTKSTQNVRNRINYLKKIKFPSAAELPMCGLNKIKTLWQKLYNKLAQI
jgi:hypothetical protein